MKKTIFLLAILLIFLNSCNQRDEISESNNLDKNVSITFNKKLNAISFKTKTDVQKFIENYPQNEDKIGDFYEKGFIPYRVKDGVDEATFNKLVSEKKKILQKSKTTSKVTDVEAEEELINNDFFASLLNAEGEVLVDDTVYKYTEQGLYMVDEEDLEYLNNYLATNSTTPQIGLTQIDSKISAYIPSPQQFEDFQIQPAYILPEEPDLGGSIGSSGSDVGFPSNTSNFQNCVPDRPWIDNIFGRTYTCEYYFSSDRKLRSTFAAEDYYLFFDVYAQAKFKQKTWLGWYSCREAQRVYLKINSANITLADRKATLKLNTDDLKKVISEIEKLLEGTSQKKVAYLSNVYSDNNGNPTIENYSPNTNEILFGANQSSTIVTPQDKRLISNISIDFKALFGKTPKKVFVVTVLGKEQVLTNEEIFKIASKAYKDFVTKQNTVVDNSAGVVIMKKAMNGTGPNEDAEIVSYAFGNDLTYVNNLAVAQRKFDIPKQFKIDKFMLDFKLEPPFIKSINIDMSWKKPDKYDVDIEAGAYYQGRWGGSKFRVIRN